MTSKPAAWDIALQFLVAAATPLIFFLPKPGIFESCDFSRMNGIGAAFYSDAIQHGRLPFWNPYINLGRPYLADVETAVLYPPNLLLPAIGVSAGTIVLCILHGLLGAMGMWVWTRYLGASRTAAHLAAASWPGCSAMAGRLLSGQVQFYFSGSYVPWMLFLAFSLRDGVSLRKVAWIALLTALTLLAGHPQVFWVGALGMGLAVVGTHLEMPVTASVKRGLVALAALAGALLGSLGICAAQLLPLIQLVQHSNRRAPSLEFAGFMALPFNALITLLTPVSTELQFDWEYNLYCGSLAFIAGLPLFWSIKKDRNCRAFMFIAALSVVIALGTQTPLFALLYRVLPGLSSFRIHARVAFLVALSLFPMGALGITKLENEKVPIWPTVLAALVLIVGITLGVGGTAGEKTLRLLLPVLACGALLAVQNASRGSLHVNVARTALALVLAFDMSVTLLWLRKAYEVQPVEANDEAFVRMLRQEKLYPPDNVPPRVSIPPQIMRENAGMLYHFSTFNGYTALSLERPWMYMHRILNLEPSDLTNTFPSPHIFESGPFPYDSMNLQVGVDPKTGAAQIRRNPDPRVFWAGKTKLVRSWQDILEEMRSHPASRKSVFVEDDCGLISGDAELKGSAEIVQFKDDEIIVAVRMDRPALLVLSEAWYPGWRGEIDGADAACIPANVWMRALPVPAGEHRVRIYFKQDGFVAGCMISALSLLICAGLIAVPLSQKACRAPLPQEP